jgi:hypothetical protein
MMLSHLTQLGHVVAYLDGGTGSMLLQAGMAGLLSLSFIFKTKWRALLSRFGRRKPSEISENDPKSD